VIKEVRALRETVVERHKFCDICRAEVRIGLACSKACCQYCGRDLCENCIGHEEETYGDYRITICEICWDIGKQYRPTIKELSERLEELRTIWQEKCKR
jgi:hypothetical protein